MIKGLVKIIQEDVKKLIKLEIPDDVKQQLHGLYNQLNKLRLILEIESEKD